MNKQQLENAIGRIEKWYNIPTETIGNLRSAHGPYVLKGVRVSSIKQSLALYLSEKEEYNLSQIAPIIGFKDHTGVIQSIESAKRLRNQGDEVFILYYNTVYGLIDKTIHGKGTKEFKDAAMVYIQKNQHKTKDQLSADLAITRGTLSVYMRELNLCDRPIFSERTQRPPAQYSNFNNISQYFD